MRKYILPTLITFLAFFNGYAQQQNPDWDAARIKSKIDRLNVLGSVLYFAAHPDDENTRLIAWLAQEKNYRTGYLSLTRGDGGQNLIGTEQGVELGLIRTQELLAARKIDQGEQFFASAYDFGFSKTPAETFAFWDKEQALREAVWIIRKFRPDVIITRFPPDARGGHGHHQASAMLAHEAFLAAADPQRFPEQLTTVRPWKATRLLWNTANFGGQNNTREDQLKINIGNFNPLLGKSYGEIAALSRSSHKSQGFGSAAQRGHAVEYFDLVDGAPATTGLFDAIDTSWKRIKNSGKIQQTVEVIRQTYSVDRPEASVPQLLKLRKLLNDVDDPYWKAVKKKEVDEIILACGGIWLESIAQKPMYTTGEEMHISNIAVVRRPEINVVVKSINGKQLNTTLVNDLSFQDTTTLRTSSTTQPYWLTNQHDSGKFNFPNFEDTGYPENPMKPAVIFEISINGMSFSIEREVTYRYTDAIRGEIYNPIVVAPNLTATATTKLALTQNGRPLTFQLSFAKSNQDTDQSFSIKAHIPVGWRVSPEKFEVRFENQSNTFTQAITVYADENTSTMDTLTFSVNDSESLNEIRKIAYDHIPTITYFPQLAITLSSMELENKVKKVGYVSGAGDLIPTALSAIGITVEQLHNEQILRQDLSSYDAIILGVRTFNVNKGIDRVMPKLLAYVEQGGTLVEQYNVNTGLLTAHLGPYPFSLSRARVTDELAPVEFDSEDVLFKCPNLITATDFDNWVQERGLYFAENVDRRYRTPIRIHDQGEDPHGGSLLATSYGKGKYIYTSLSFFRQLPAGVPGAYRLFVNLLLK